MPGYPRPCRVDKKDVDARHKAGHDEFLAPHLMVRDGASAPPHHEGVVGVPTSQLLILRSIAKRGVSKDGPGRSWFETALKKRLLTMRIPTLFSHSPQILLCL